MNVTNMGSEKRGIVEADRERKLKRGREWTHGGKNQEMEKRESKGRWYQERCKEEEEWREREKEMKKKKENGEEIKVITRRETTMRRIKFRTKLSGKTIVPSNINKGENRKEEEIQKKERMEKEQEEEREEKVIQILIINTAVSERKENKNDRITHHHCR